MIVLLESSLSRSALFVEGPEADETALERATRSIWRSAATGGRTGAGGRSAVAGARSRVTLGDAAAPTARGGKMRDVAELSTQRRSEIYKRQGAVEESEQPMYEIAYDEAKRSVDSQLSELDGMRQRVVQFLAFIGSATAFLVGTSIGPRSAGSRDDVFYTLTICATAASVILMILVVVILRGLALVPTGRQEFPKRLPGTITWRFRIRPTSLVRWLDASIKPNSTQFTQFLVEKYEEMRIWNDGWLRIVRRYYAAYIGMGVIQLALWGSLAWHNG